MARARRSARSARCERPPATAAGPVVGAPLPPLPSRSSPSRLVAALGRRELSSSGADRRALTSRHHTTPRPAHAHSHSHSCPARLSSSSWGLFFVGPAPRSSARPSSSAPTTARWMTSSAGKRATRRDRPENGLGDGDRLGSGLCDGIGRGVRCTAWRRRDGETETTQAATQAPRRRRLPPAVCAARAQRAVRDQRAFLAAQRGDTTAFHERGSGQA